MADSAQGGGQIGLPCTMYRGGTSRGVLLLSRDLPYPREALEQMLLRIFGSPDVRQIDGVGGGSSQTSKAMFVDVSDAPDQDLQMRFAQVAVDSATVDWGGNCGNMTAAIGPFAIEAGLVAAVEPTTFVRIVSLNTGSCVAAHVPVRDGMVITEGDYEIPGVPGRGARITLEWFEPGGSVTGQLLPTGKALDVVTLRDGRSLEISIVDAVNPVAFCDGRALGLRGTELPREIEGRADVRDALEEVRALAAEMLGIVPSRDVATRLSPGLPKVAFVAPPHAYRTAGGTELSEETHNVHARLMSMQTPHRSYAVSGGVCTAVAAAIDGTVVRACSTEPRSTDGTFHLAHPYGVMDVQVEMTEGGPTPHVRTARIGRTARRIMSGLAYVPASILTELQTTGR